MADGGERDTAYLKQGLQSIFRRETITALPSVARTVFSALSGLIQPESLATRCHFGTRPDPVSSPNSLTTQLALVSSLTRWDTQTALQTYGKS